MNSWNGLDFFIFLIFAINTILGLSRGAMKEIISMMCLNVALIITIKFTLPLTQFMNSSPLIQDVLDTPFVTNFMSAIGAQPLTANMLNELSYCISMMICFAGAFSVCEAGLVVTGAVDVFSFPYATWNRKVGGALGFLRGYILTILLVVIMLHLFARSELTTGSRFVNLFRGTASTLDNLISGQRVEQYREIYRDSKKIDQQEFYRAIAPTQDQIDGVRR